MATSRNVGLIVHHGCGTDQPPIGGRRVSRSIGYSGLLSVLYDMMNIDSNRYMLKISAALFENNTLQLVPINSDEDLWCFFDPEAGNRNVHLHVDSVGPPSTTTTDVRLMDDYYQYAAFLRDDAPNSMVFVTQGLANIVVGDYAGGPSNATYHDAEIEGTSFSEAGLSDDQTDDPLVDSFGANEIEDSESDDSGSDNEDGGDDVNVEDLHGMYNQHAHDASPLQQISAPVGHAEYAMHHVVPFFTASCPEIFVDSCDRPKKLRFYDANEGVLAKGMVFKDKKNLQSAVKDFAVRVARREYWVVESTPQLWKVKCKNGRGNTNCEWGLRAVFKNKFDMWQITKYEGPHTCLMNAISVDHHNLCKNMIAMLLTGMVQTDPGYEVKLVQQQVKEKYQYEISYHKAWHSLKRARENVYGTWESSVMKLPKFMRAVQKWNPGTVVKWHHVDNRTPGIKMLKYVFWAFRPCIDGFQQCRKVISVDGTHLYTKYKHKMLIAVAMDANQQILPLAYAIVDEETFASWKWFLKKLSKHVVRGAEGLCLISDRHPGLLQAVKHVVDFRPPRGVHRFCLRHVCSNFNTLMKNVKLKDMCWEAGSAFTVRHFDNVMEQIRASSEKGYAYLKKIGDDKWTVAHDGGWRCGIMTTNLSECMNGVLKGARRLPICAIVQVTLYRSTKYFFDRLSLGRQMQQRNQPWPDEIYKQYDQRQRQALHHAVFRVDLSEQSASVKTFTPGSTSTFTHVVKLSTGECSCGKWTQNSIPCSHAMQTCRHYGVNPGVYIKSYYNTSYYVDTYSGKFNPLPDEYYWDEASFALCHNPELRVTRRRGRDKTTRIQNEMDWPQVRARQQYLAQETSRDQPSSSNRQR